MPVTRHALIVNGQVAEERMHDTDTPVKFVDGKPVLRPIQEVTAPFNPDTQTYTISREIQNFKVVDTWVVQDKPRGEVNARFKAALAAHRYSVETGGITLNGSQIQTDRESRANLDAARTVAIEAKAYASLKVSSPQAAAAYPDIAKQIYERAITDGITWKAASGFVTLPVDHTILVANVAFDFVQRCFLAEEAVTANIATYNTVAEVTAAFDAFMSN
jgi:hypothetical protein